MDGLPQSVQVGGLRDQRPCVRLLGDVRIRRQPARCFPGPPWAAKILALPRCALFRHNAGPGLSVAGSLLECILECHRGAGARRKRTLLSGDVLAAVATNSISVVAARVHCRAADHEARLQLKLGAARPSRRFESDAKHTLLRLDLGTMNWAEICAAVSRRKMKMTQRTLQLRQEPMGRR